MYKYKELKLTSFFNSCNLALAICNLNLDFLEVNDRTLQLLECEKIDIIGQNVSKFSVDKGLSFNFKQFNKLISKEIKSYTFNRFYKTKNGNELYGAVTASLLELDNEKYVFGIFNLENKTPIDDFHLDSYESLNKILTLNPDIHYIVDTVNLNFIYENTSTLNYLGYKNEDLNGESPIDFMRNKIDRTSLNYTGKNNLELNNKKLEGFIESEFRVKSKNGDWIWLKSRSIELIRNDELNLKLRYVILQDITEDKKSENELFSNYKLLDIVTKLMPDTVFVYSCSSFETIYSNFNQGTFLGYNEEECENFNYPKAHPDYENLLLNQMKELNVIEKDEIKVFEVPFISKSGEVRWLLSKNKLFKRDKLTGETYILSVVSDVQDYRNAIEELKVSQSTNTAIINAIPDLILVVNKKGDYLYSYSGHEIKIHTNNEVVGKNVVDIIEQPIANNILNNIVKCIENGTLIQYEFELRNSIDENGVHFSNYFSKLSDDTAIILIRNITQRKEAEKELSNKIKLLSDQNEKMEQFISKNTELERFAYILSHDLKEPLRGASTIAEILNKEIQSLNNTKLETLTKHLIDSADRMNSMIDGVLEYSKTSNDHIEFKLVSITGIVKQVLNDLDLLINETQTKIIVKELPEVMGSEIQLRQLLQNLINNAIKFNNKANPYVEIGSYTTENELVYYVKDNGIGIKNQFKDSVFKMFRRLNSSKNFAGQGLGLSICKKIVERHNGRIWFESNTEEESGSIFYFALPILN